MGQESGLGPGLLGFWREVSLDLGRTSPHAFLELMAGVGAVQQNVDARHE